MPVVHTTDVPLASKAMTFTEVCNFQWDVVKSWDRKSDVWSFTAGIWAMSAAALLSGGWMGTTLRRVFKVSKSRTLTIILPVAVVPPAIVHNLQSQWVMPDIFLFDMKQCIVCPLVKSIIQQVGMGACYPVAVGSLVCWGMAYQESAVLYNVPHYTEYRKVSKYLYEYTRPLFPRIAMLVLAQTIVAGGMTYYQYHQWNMLKAYSAVLEGDLKEILKQQSKQIAEREAKLQKRKILEMEKNRNKLTNQKELLQD